MRLSRPLLIMAVLLGVLALAACGDGARDAVDQARSEARSALDESGLRDDLDRTYERVDELLDRTRDAAGPELRSAQRRVERAFDDSRARIEQEIREARREGATDAEIARLRREARERLDALRDRIDEAFGP